MADLGFLNDDWPAISQRLDEALALGAGQRGAWLDALDEPEAVKHKLRQLLGEADGIETGEFLGALPRLSLGPLPADDGAAPGAVLGPYRLIREIGVGGMGHVWLAERVDGGLKRPVALKLPRLAGSRGLAERMGRERDILASLDHPNIARLYDAGVDAHGQPFLALEWVDGQAIDQHCRTQALGLAARLQLILQVAHAVAHAHARLVVHRDLKPSNILVTAEGQVRLLDFGIAKLIEDESAADSPPDSPLTQQAGRALTLDYASPEQIRGEAIGTASDVYSLAVVAYELLTEAKPYRLQRQSAAALEEAIASVDVRLPSAAAANPATARALKGDLDAILNKALKKDVAQRYPTVDAFALDIERHLAHLPVTARPDALGYRLRRFLRRNALAVAASTAVAVALLAGLSVALWQQREALAQADRAERVKEFTLSIFDDADSASEAGTSRTAADLLQAARKRVASELGGRPDVAVELMTAIGQSMVGQGLTADAATLLHEAVALSTASFGALHTLTCAAQVALAEAQVELGRNTEAIATLGPCIASSRALGDVANLNAGLRWLSTAQANDGQRDAMLTAAREAVATLALRPRVGKPLTPRDAMLSHQALADALGTSDDPGAVAAARQALDAAHQVYGQTVVPSVLDIRSMLGLALVSAGQVREGLQELDGVLAATEGLLGPQHPRVSKIAHLVGNARLSAGDVRGAIVVYRRSVAIEDANATSDFDRGMARFFLGSAYAGARAPDDALSLLGEAEALLRASVGPDNARTLRARSAHAAQLAEAGRLAEAEAEFSSLDAAPWNDVDRAGHQRRLASLRSLQGRHGEAVQLAQAAADVLSKIANQNLQARGQLALGVARLEAGNAQAALAPLQQARALFERMQLQVSPDTADTLAALGRAQWQLGDGAAALQSLAAADAFWRAFDPGNRRAELVKQSLSRVASAPGGTLRP